MGRHVRGGAGGIDCGGLGNRQGTPSAGCGKVAPTCQASAVGAQGGLVISGTKAARSLQPTSRIVSTSSGVISSGVKPAPGVWMQVRVPPAWHSCGPDWKGR